MSIHNGMVSPAFREALQDAATSLSMTDAALPAALPSLGRRRRGGRLLVDENVKFLSLVSVDGVLEWRENVQAESPLRRQGRRGRIAGVEVIEQLPFEKLERSQVTGFLNNLDARLTPHQGLYQVGADGTLKLASPPTDGKALVLIHGTFSDPQRYVNGLRVAMPGGDFLTAALKHYEKRVFVFGHPTLAASPIENALELAHLFQDSRSEIDVIAHSRGGLVTRWWFEGVWRGRAKPGKAVLVGAPLAGTSLAAPPRIRSTFKMLTNVANVLGAVSGAAATVAPIMTLVTGLMKLVGSFTSIMADTPVADALIAMVPGFVAQSRVGNQTALVLLRKHFPLAKPPQYHVVSADFEPEDVPLWQFWKRFTVKHGVDLATDAIFNAPNDLVVDTASMSDFADGFPLPVGDRLEFPPGAKIWHINYFEQPEVVDFLSRKLLAASP